MSRHLRMWIGLRAGATHVLRRLPARSSYLVGEWRRRNPRRSAHRQRWCLPVQTDRPSARETPLAPLFLEALSEALHAGEGVIGLPDFPGLVGLGEGLGHVGLVALDG